MGMIEMIKKNYKAAEYYLTESIESQPDFLESYIARAKLYRILQRKTE